MRSVLVLLFLFIVGTFGRECTDVDVFSLIDSSDLDHLHECMLTVQDKFGQLQDNNIIKRTPLIYASSEGKLEVAEAILNSYPSSIEDRDGERRTSLMWASWNGHLELVKLLVAKGSRFDDIDSQGRNSLMFAVMGKHMHVISYVTSSLEHSPRDLESLITHKDINGKHSLDYALERGATQINNYLTKFVLHHQEQEGIEPVQMVGLRTSSRVHHVGDQMEVKEPQPSAQQKDGRPVSCSGNVVSWIRVCDSNGHCVPEGSKSCCPYACDESTNQCRRSCMDDSDCCDQFVCSSTRKCVLKRNLFDWRAAAGFIVFLGILFYVFS